MRKRLFSLALALALCLVLAVPALAVDASGLDARGAQAFYDALSAYGNVDKLYANLLDMDGDKVPELIAVTAPKEATRDSVAYKDDIGLDIWKIKAGTASKAVHFDCNPSYGGYGSLRYFASNGKNFICCGSFSMQGGAFSGTDTYISANGIAEQFYYDGENVEPGSEGTNFYRVTGGKKSPVTKAEHDQYIRSYQGGEVFLASELGAWYCNDTERAAYQNVLTQLRTKANEVPSKPTTSTPAPTATGTYGPYSINVSDDYDASTIYFEAAKAERKTVQVKSFSYEPGDRPYENTQIILVTVRPGSQITIKGTGFWAENGWASGDTGEIQGTDRFTIQYSAPNEALFSGPAEKSLANNKMVSPHWTNGDLPYFIVLGKDTTPSTSAFRDVPTNAYYATPVSWAVSKGITNGTSATAFSPDKTCTTAEILTFLWRASGSPEPTGRNPFTNIKASDYYYKAAVWAAQKGMVSGSTFPGNVPCTRASAVKFIWQSLGSPRPSAQSSFRDVSSTASYAPAVSWAVGAGITNGTSSTTFSPNDTCTRGQIVTFLHRAMG